MQFPADARGSLATWLQRCSAPAHGTATGLRQKDHVTHSMRRTKAVMIYRITRKLRAVQILLGHTKIEDTVRYLGVDGLAECTEIGPSRRLSGVARWPLFCRPKAPNSVTAGLRDGTDSKSVDSPSLRWFRRIDVGSTTASASG